jgi:acyl carrier protein
MMAIEEEFEVTLSEDGAEKIQTVQEAADMIYQVIQSPKA